MSTLISNVTKNIVTKKYNDDYDSVNPSQEVDKMMINFRAIIDEISKDIEVLTANNIITSTLVHPTTVAVCTLNPIMLRNKDMTAYDFTQYECVSAFRNGYIENVCRQSSIMQLVTHIQQHFVINKNDNSISNIGASIDFTKLLNFYNDYNSSDIYSKDNIIQDLIYTKILMPCNLNLVYNGTIANGLTISNWLNLQYYCKDIIAKYKFNGLIRILQNITARLGITNDVYFKILPDICNNITRTNVFINESNIYLLHTLIEDTLSTYIDSNAITNSNNTSHDIQYRELTINRIREHMSSKVYHVLASRQLSSITKQDLDNAFQSYSPSHNSLIESVTRKSATTVIIKFKEKLSPYKIKYGNQYYILSDDAVNALLPSIKISSIEIDFGRISNKYPTCWAKSSSHPNVGTGDNMVCLGTIKTFTNEMNKLNGLPFPPFSELVNMLTMINFDSAYRMTNNHSSIFNNEFANINSLQRYCSEWNSTVATRFDPSIDKYLSELDGIDD